MASNFKPELCPYRDCSNPFHSYAGRHDYGPAVKDFASFHAAWRHGHGSNGCCNWCKLWPSFAPGTVSPPPNTPSPVTLAHNSQTRLLRAQSRDPTSLYDMQLGHNSVPAINEILSLLNAYFDEIHNFFKTQEFPCPGMHDMSNLLSKLAACLKQISQDGQALFWDCNRLGKALEDMAALWNTKASMGGGNGGGREDGPTELYRLMDQAYGRRQAEIDGEVREKIWEEKFGGKGKERERRG